MGHTRRALLAAAAAGALLLSLLPGVSSAAAPAQPVPGASGAGDSYFPLYGNGGYDVRHYGLDIRYDPATDVLAGVARVRLRPTVELSRFDLDLVGLTVRELTVDGVPATWTRESGQELVIVPAQPLPAGRDVTVRVRYDGIPVPYHFPGLGTYGFLATPDGAIAVGQPEVAASWFPVDDHPSDKATYRIALTAPADLQAISNGLPSPRVVRGGWATTTWQVRDPMASYLSFLAIGHFAVHRWKTASDLPVIDAVDPAVPASVRRRIDASFRRQGEILAVESAWFGPYPFEAAGGVVDVVPIGFALENQTRPTYSMDFWNIPDRPTLGNSVVVHELAHQWYGDSVALEQWRDIWLNEGFATYAEWLWAEREFGFTPQEFFDSEYRRPANDPLWQLEIGDAGPVRLFDQPVYVRGAMTLQALRTTVGTADFFRILRTWARVHRNRNGTTAEFITLAERISGRSLHGLFHDWLYTATKPPPATATAAAEVPAARRTAVDAAVRRWVAGLGYRLAAHRS
jgi:aminopeptidase N